MRLLDRAIPATDSGPRLPELGRFVGAGLEPVRDSVVFLPAMCQLSDLFGEQNEGFRTGNDLVHDDPEITHHLVEGGPQWYWSAFAQSFHLQPLETSTTAVVGDDIDATSIPSRRHDVPSKQ